MDNILDIFLDLMQVSVLLLTYNDIDYYKDRKLELNGQNYFLKQIFFILLKGLSFKALYQNLYGCVHLFY